jgi:HlyD family secretion protein
MMEKSWILHRIIIPTKNKFYNNYGIAMALFRSFAFYLALIGIGLALFLVKIIYTPSPESEPITEPAANPYENTIAASGIIEAVDRNIAIGVPQSGLVEEIFVQVWDPVQKGQPLFQLDDRELQAQLIVQKTNVEVAQANVERLKDQLSRLQGVKDARAVSREELKTKENDVKVAMAQLTMAEAQVKQTLLLIERLTVRAPRNGVILQNNIRVGEFISSSSNTPAMVLGNLERLQVRVDVDEQNASRVIPNLKATAFPKNNSSLAIPLYFERIEPYVIPKKSLTGASEERVDTRVLQVIYSFDKPTNFPLYVGQQVDVFIEEPVHENK